MFHIVPSVMPCNVLIIFLLHPTPWDEIKVINLPWGHTLVMSTILLVASDLYPASANCLDLKCHIPSGSWGLPESSQTQVRRSHQKGRTEPPRHAAPLPCAGISGQVHSPQLLSEPIPSWFWLFPCCPGFPFSSSLLPSSSFPPLVFVFPFLQTSPSHYLRISHSMTQALSLPFVPHPSLNISLSDYVHPFVCLTCDFGDVGFFYLCRLHLFLLIAGCQ